MSSNSPYAVGIDIGGTNTKASVISQDGKVLDSRHLPTQQEREPLVAVVKQLLTDLKTDGLPVGISSPGMANRDNRSIRWMRGRMHCVEGLVWGDALGRPVAVLNDAHAATYGEAWRGAAVGKQHVVLLTLGTGVGGGVITSGHLLQGTIGRAGHLGHVCVDLHGKPDLAKTPGSIEDFIGNHNVGERTGGRFNSTADLVAAVRKGDEAATRVWQTSIRALACAIVSFINSFDPEIVVIGGGIALSGDALFKPLAKELDEIEWRPLDVGVPIVPATLGDVAGAIGVAHYAATRKP